MARKPTVRFAVVDPVTKRHSGVWRVWASNDDVYIAPQRDGGVYKVSLHPAVYRIAYTREHWESGEVPNNAPGPGRAIVEYEPTEPVDGVRHGWSLVFQLGALLATDELAPKVAAITECAPSDVVKVDVWICDEDVRRRPEQPISPSPLRLASGASVWVGWETGHAAAEPGHDPTRRDYPTAILLFRERDTPRDAPGFQLVPADVK